jgi:hypothetical protein
MFVEFSIIRFHRFFAAFVTRKGKIFIDFFMFKLKNIPKKYVFRFEFFYILGDDSISSINLTECQEIFMVNFILLSTFMEFSRIVFNLKFIKTLWFSVKNKVVKIEKFGKWRRLCHTHKYSIFQYLGIEN